ncbi:MAG: hypothetical protein AMJ65_06955 [Phycisphaerae bacterium SG8_4]|nr:MAG: hypothetical protein AMJ65_06955 [Phycisphaerae bacterium SG8_4]
MTSLSDKWHYVTHNDENGKYDPRGRGFDEYWVGLNGIYFADFDRAGICVYNGFSGRAKKTRVVYSFP